MATTWSISGATTRTASRSIATSTPSSTARRTNTVGSTPAARAGASDDRTRTAARSTLWKVISPEEVTAEVVAALAKQDVDRFSRLLLTAEELQSLGLGQGENRGRGRQVRQGRGRFPGPLARQKASRREPKWVQFGGSQAGHRAGRHRRPDQGPAGLRERLAIVQTGGKHGQVQIGTLVHVGDAWRVIDAPALRPRARRKRRRRASSSKPPWPIAPGGRRPRRRATERRNSCPTWRNSTSSTRRRADCLSRLPNRPRRRKNDDVVSPVGRHDQRRGAVGQVARRRQAAGALFNKLQKNEADKNLAAYVQIPPIDGPYTPQPSRPRKADFAKIQAEWLKTLEQYIADYPDGPDAAEAMLQLGIAREFAGQEDDAKKWYGRIVQEFADSPAARKAAGAADAAGFGGQADHSLRARASPASTVDLAKLPRQSRADPVLGHLVRAGQDRHGRPEGTDDQVRRSFTVLGVSLDTNAKDLNDYLAENRLPWPQIFEEGGLDSRPANLLGIITAADDDPGRPGRQGGQPQHPDADIEGELKKLVK